MDYYISYADWDLLNARIREFSDQKNAAPETPETAPVDEGDSDLNDEDLDDEDLDDEDLDDEDWDDEDWDDEEEQDHFGEGVFFDGPDNWYASSSAYAEVAQVLDSMKAELDDEVKDAAEKSALTLISANGLCSIFDFPVAPEASMGLDQWFMALCPERVSQINDDFQKFRIEDCEALFNSMFGDSQTLRMKYSDIENYVNMWKTAFEKAVQNNWAVTGTWG